MENREEIKRLQFKVIILGDGTVGKTSITKRFTSDEFKQSYLQTIGVDWFIKTVLLPGNIYSIFFTKTIYIFCTKEMLKLLCKFGTLGLPTVHPFLQFTYLNLQRSANWK